jgi:hypothetical protein
MNYQVLYSLIGSLYPQNKEKEQQYHIIIDKLENNITLSHEEKFSLVRLIENGIFSYSKKINDGKFSEPNEFEYKDSEIKYFKECIDDLNNIYNTL